jgi:hypothetical protein
MIAGDHQGGMAHLRCLLASIAGFLGGAFALFVRASDQVIPPESRRTK